MLVFVTGTVLIVLVIVTCTCLYRVHGTACMIDATDDHLMTQLALNDATYGHIMHSIHSTADKAVLAIMRAHSLPMPLLKTASAPV